MLAAEHSTRTRAGRLAILRRGAALNKAVRDRARRAEEELLGDAAKPQRRRRQPSPQKQQQQQQQQR